MTDSQPERLLSFSGLFLAALVGGCIAYWLRGPMPFLIGGVAGAALFVVTLESSGRRLYKPSPYIRLGAIAATGAMIGAKVSPSFLSILPSFWISGCAVLPFILVAHAGSYLILRVLGRYSKTDAYFAAMPGGLIEAVLLGEKAGADVRVLTVQHFIRVLSIVMLVPLLFYLSTGVVVGSASGASAVVTEYSLRDIGLILLLALCGLAVGRRLRLPAAHLLGPLLLAVAVSVTGVATISVPPWLLHLAQLIVGATLGAQFSGISRSVLRRGFAMGILSVTYMLCVGYLFALMLAPLVPADVAAMFISFAAGGLAEMSLIALSLDLSPVVVALHHLVRIFLTIWVGHNVYRRFLQTDRS